MEVETDLTGYRPKKCVWLVGSFPWGAGVEFVPVDAGAVSGRDAEELLPAFVAVFPCLLVELLDLLVAPCMSGEPCGAFWVFGVLVAPPAHRLDAPDEAQAAVVAQHGADARVLRFDGVVGGRHGRADAQGGVHEGEHGSLADAPAHDVARLDEALVRVILAAVGPCAPLLEEVPVPVLPCVVGGQPRHHGVAVAHARELPGQPQQLSGCLVSGSDAEVGGYVEADVEQAALHPGSGPCVPEGLVDAAPTVAHDNGGFGDAGHQAHPSGAGLAPGHVPAQHMPVAVGDEHDRLPSQMDAVEVHHVVDLAVHRARRPQAPPPVRCGA